MKPQENLSQRHKTKKKETQDDTKETEEPKEPKYGPLPKIPYQRIWSRMVLILGAMAVVYFSSKDTREFALAKQKEILPSRVHNIECSESYRKEIDQYPGCATKQCSRMITDKLLTAAETMQLLDLAKRGLSLGNSDGAASILDLHSGALSKGTEFVNIYKLKETKDIFKKSDFTIYRLARIKIQQAIAHHFGIETENVYLTHPTFFSKMTSAPAKTIHDEYWHPHVDKETYEAFHYTSLLYLSDYNLEFEGGRFVFIDPDKRNRTIEPRKGRVSMFTSGAENLHFVEKVTKGTRYALTVSFTCDKKSAISDPPLMLKN